MQIFCTWMLDHAASGGEDPIKTSPYSQRPPSLMRQDDLRWGGERYPDARVAGDCAQGIKGEPNRGRSRCMSNQRHNGHAMKGCLQETSRYPPDSVNRMQAWDGFCSIFCRNR